MASVKKGILTSSPQWWKHLRDWKRVFWKAERKAARIEAYSSCGCVFCDVGLPPIDGYHSIERGDKAHFRCTGTEVD